MTNLRILGTIIGILGLIGTFLIFRGSKWKRSNFVLFSLFCMALTIVSINPNLVNFILDALSMKQSARGRIIVLLILSNLFLLFFSFYTKSKLENIRLQFDQLIRSLGASDLEDTIVLSGLIKPIMVVIPAFNEEDNLKELLPKLPSKIKGVEVGILVINDGSEDETIKLINDMGHLVVSNKINRGQGAASRLGYDILIKKNVPIGVTMDADGQHNPDDIVKLVSPILDDKYDLVVGSRILGKGQKTTTVREMGIRIFSAIISILISQKITDCSSGYKAFNINKLRGMNLTEDQFQSAEVLIEASKKGLRIAEVPTNINRRQYGKSKKGTDWSYGFNFTKTILKAWWKL